MNQADNTVHKRILQRAGGRHLVFRINQGSRWILPKPYVLISNIEGSILAFYGIGQIWITHHKKERIGDWLVRYPRIASGRLQSIVAALKGDIAEFINKIDSLDVIGTIVLERRVIEFHWTLPSQARADEQTRQDLTRAVNLEFNHLANRFAQLQLAGEEGVEDTDTELVDENA